MFLFVAGISYKSGPLEHREHVAEHLSKLLKRLAALKRLSILSESVVISTCNRTEIYGVSTEEISVERLVERFFLDTGGPSFDEAKSSLYVHTGDAAVWHLMNVATGLDALVMGEVQILGQVREAFKSAQKSFSAGPVLSRLFAVALRWSRRARNESGLCRFAVSVAYAAVELARRIFGDISSIPVAVIGSGEMGVLVLEQLTSSGTGNVMVLNRTLKNAENLAARFGGEAFGLDSLVDCLSKVDVCISSTASTSPVITCDIVKEVMGRREGRPLFLLDLAVPRDVDGEVAEISSVYVYNVDDLQNVVSSNLEAREAAARSAETVFSEGIKEFLSWFRSRTAVPMLGKIEKKIEDVVDEEFERLMNKISTDPVYNDKIRNSLRRVCRKLLHPSIVRIRHWSGEGDEELSSKIDVAADLLGLNTIDNEETVQQNPDAGID
jgi:glutamyl-tRNA reductase